MRRLQHENIIQLVTQGQGHHSCDGKSQRVEYGVFELAENGELFDLVEVAAGFEEPLARHYMR